MEKKNIVEFMKETDRMDIISALEETQKNDKKLMIKVKNIVSYLRNDIIKRFPEFDIVFEVPNSYLDYVATEFYNLSRKEIIFMLLKMEGAYAVIKVNDERYKLYNPAMAYIILTDLLARNKKFKLSYMRTGKKDFRFYTAENLLLLYKGCDNCKIRKIK